MISSVDFESLQCEHISIMPYLADLTKNECNIHGITSRDILKNMELISSGFIQINIIKTTFSHGRSE